jgi:ribonucleoside-diphosphate reductase alpha chain
MLSGLTLLMSAILRRAEHPLFMVEDLERVQSTQGAWVKGKYVPGVVALIAGVLRRHMGLADEAVSPAPVEPPIGEPCPKCGAPALIRSDGCKKCLSCSYSECN